jgi:hypothetical protein
MSLLESWDRKGNRMDTKKAGERREGDKKMEEQEQGKCFNMEWEGGREEGGDE